MGQYINNYEINLIFDKNDKEFFLWDASLLGAARDQGTIAGSARDIDIAIIFNKKKNFVFIISLKKSFSHEGNEIVILFNFIINWV